MSLTAFKILGSDNFSESIPKLKKSSADATAAEAKPSVCVIEPTMPWGQRGEPSGNVPTSRDSFGSIISIALAAHKRPASNSAFLLGELNVQAVE